MATYDYINASGVVIPDTSTVLAEVEAEYQEVYGTDFIIDPSSEQGRQIDAEVTSRMSVLRNNAKLANQINPNMAEDVFLDAIYALANGERDGAERSTAVCTIGGVAGTILPEGTRARDVNREEWQTTGDVTIPASGVIDADFISVNYGSIEADTGEIDTIVDGILGWESVTNSAAATPGKTQQSDVSTRRQRKIELGGNANNNALAIITSVSNVDNVNSLIYRENFSNDPMTIDDITLQPNSNYICVDGGLDSEIAEAYYNSRSGGSGFNGGVEVTVVDPNSNQSIPVKFDRPTDKPKMARVTIKSTAGSYLTDSVKNAVVAYANGEVAGESGFVVGANVSAFEIGAAVNYEVANVFVSKCEIAEKSASPVYTTDTIVTKITEKASITAGDVEVIIL